MYIINIRESLFVFVCFCFFPLSRLCTSRKGALRFREIFDNKCVSFF